MNAITFSTNRQMPGQKENAEPDNLDVKIKTSQKDGKVERLMNRSRIS